MLLQRRLPVQHVCETPHRSSDPARRRRLMPSGAEPQHEPQDHQDRLHLAQPPAAEEEFRSFAELTLREIDNRYSAQVSVRLGTC